MEHQDGEIIERCLAGERSAYALLVDRYKKPVFVFAYRMVNQREEAEDLAQETFIRAYASLARYNPTYKFSTWLFQIAKNLCLDHLRRKRPVAAPAELEVLPATEGSPEALYLAKEGSRALEQAIQALPEQQRACLILYHYNGLSYQAVAETLRVPLQTVKNQINRARGKLRVLLQTEGGGV